MNLINRCRSYSIYCFTLYVSEVATPPSLLSNKRADTQHLPPTDCRPNSRPFPPLCLQGDPSNPKLVLKKPRRSGNRTAKEISDLLVWGELVVYPSPHAAKESLPQECLDEEYVRVLRIATNAQLQLMLEPGTERCTTEAALYLKVDMTCPIYWARWNSTKSKADLDISCDIPQRGSRAKVLEKVGFSEDGSGGVKVRHARNKPSATTIYTDSPLFISTECGRVVGSEMFDSAVGGVGEEKAEEEEEEEGENAD